MTYPLSKKKVKFSNYKARWFALVVIYFDLESVMRQLAQCFQEKQKKLKLSRITRAMRILTSWCGAWKN